MSWRAVTTTYERVTWTGHRSGPCAVCGKRATRSRTFENTISPFNRNEDGSVRSYREVSDRVRAMAAEWSEGAPAHARCEP